MNDLIAFAGPYIITKTWYVDGTPTDVGEVRITITDANGTEVVPSIAVTNNGDGVYTYDLANQETLTVLKAVWTRIDTGASLAPDYFEVVGNVLFTEAEARARTITGLQTPLSDVNEYPDSFISEWRRRITGQFERKTGKSWIRRYCRIVTAGWGTDRLSLLDGHARTSDGAESGGPGRHMGIARIISATSEDVALDVDDLALDGFYVYSGDAWPRPTSSARYPVVIEYEYGDAIVDLEANDHGLRMLLANAVPNDISAYASSFNSQDGSVTFTEGRLAYPSKTWEWLKGNDHRARL